MSDLETTKTEQQVHENPLLAMTTDPNEFCRH